MADWATDDIPRRRFCAPQKSGPLRVRFGSKATFPTHRAHVRYYPKSDRNSDMPGGRYVPLQTKVQRSKKVLI
jgi:hypothetical protein